MIRFTRTGGQHKLDLSSDIVGPMTTYGEEAMDCHFAYFTGASGNINPSRISSENITSNYVERGQDLGRYTVLVCTDMIWIASNKVQLVAQSYEGKSTAAAVLRRMALPSALPPAVL